MKKIYLSTACLLFTSFLMAQSPGGVSTSLSLWLRADAGSTLTSTDSLNSWAYFNLPANVFTSVVTNRPIVQPQTFNFLPSVFFNGVQEMDGPTVAAAPITINNPAYSIFAVWSTNQSSGVPQRVWSQRSTGSAGDGGALWILNGQYGDQDEIGPSYIQGLGLAANPGVQYISEVNLLAQNASDLELVDQTNVGGSTVVLSSDPAGQALTDRQISNLVNRLGSRNFPNEEPFFGNLAELIVYNNSVNAGASRNQIFSYLSMKYGIPVGISLLSSAGSTVWDAVANSTYNNAVFGLALDNTSGLSVSQSNSAGTGSGSGSGQSGGGNIVVAISPISTDQSFLMIGHDNNPLTETTSNLPAASSGSSRLARNWKVANTNTVGPVALSFDLTGLVITGAIGTTTDFRLIINSAGDPSFAAGSTSYYTPAGFTGNVANFSNVTLSDGSIFTIITNASGATPLPVNWISFAAQSNGNDVDLNWAVANNQQASTYEVDHSLNGVNFSKIGVVRNSADQTAYSFVHSGAGPGQHFYRIQEFDLDGKEIDSKIVSATIGAGDFSVAVLNNPAAGNTDAQLQINAVSSGTALIELWTVGGSRLSLQQEAIGTGPNTISVPMSKLASGSYVVKIMVNNTVRVAQLVKL